MITVDFNPKVLGTLPNTKPFTFQYVLSAGIDAITITQISAGCGSCTIASIDTAVIAPNTSQTLNVTFTPGALGATTKKITLGYLEATLEKNIVLEFSATII